MKKAITSISIAAVIVLLVSLAWYLDFKLGFVPGDNTRLAVTVPCLPSVSHHLNGGCYLFSIKNFCLFAFVVFLTYWRILLLIKNWKPNS